MDAEAIEKEAMREFQEEKRRIAVNAAKERLSRRKWWHKFVPFVVKITWRK